MIINFLKKIIHNYTRSVDTETGALNSIPNFIIWRSLFVSWSALIQLFADILLETLILLSIFPFYLEFRLEFFFLAIISAVVGYLAMHGLKNGDLDVTRSSLTIGLVVESSLIISDLYYLMNINSYFWQTVIIRTPFIVFTMINMFLILSLLFISVKVQKRRPNMRF